MFNPLTVYWCHRADGELACVVAEVHNTYGERHCYLLRTDEGGRAETDKDFYVSPFLTVDGQYRMVLPVPDERLRISITLRQHDATALVATVVGDRRPATPAALLRDAAAPPAGHPTHHRPDPPPRHRAVAAPHARHPPAYARTAGGCPVSTEPISPTSAPDGVRRSNKHFVPRPNEGVWPGLATPPSSPFRAQHRRGAVQPGRALAAGARGVPRRRSASAPAGRRRR